MSYCVYKHTDPYGKVYIGATSQKPQYRWRGGNGYRQHKRFYDAIMKYGWDNFTHEILLSGISKSEAYEKEISLIKLYHSTEKEYGHNESAGGEFAGKGRHPSEETRMKLRVAHGGKNHPLYGKHPSEETRKKLIASHKGKHHSDVTRRKMSASRSGENHPMYGKHFSNEARKHMSDAHKGNSGPNQKSIICIETGEKFSSLHEAERIKHISSSHICSCCKGKRETAGGYHWEYRGGAFDRKLIAEGLDPAINN